MYLQFKKRFMAARSAVDFTASQRRAGQVPNCLVDRVEAYSDTSMMPRVCPMSPSPFGLLEAVTDRAQCWA